MVKKKEVPKKGIKKPKGIKKKKMIVVQGVSVDFTLPSESRLKEHHIERDDKTKIDESITIREAPRRIMNLLKTQRRKFYRELQRNAFVIGKGAGHRNLYIVPLEKVDKFLQLRDEMSGAYREIDGEIRRYFDGETTDEEKAYLEQVKRYLNERGLMMKDCPTVAEHFTVDFLPLRMDPSFFEDYVDEETKKKLADSMAKVKKEIEDTRKRIISKEIEDLNGRFEVLLKRLLDATRKVNPTSVEKTVDNIMDLAKTGGVDWVIEDVADATKDLAVILSKEKVEEKDLKKTVEKLAKVIDINVTDNPLKDLEYARMQLKGVTPRQLALLKKLEE